MKKKTKKNLLIALIIILTLIGVASLVATLDIQGIIDVSGVIEDLEYLIDKIIFERNGIIF